MSERLNIYRITDTFILYACAAVLVLRVFLPAFLYPNESYVSSESAQTLVSGLIILSAILYLVKKMLLKEAFLPSGFELPLLLMGAGATVSLIPSVYREGSFLYLIHTFAQVMFFYMLADLLRKPGSSRVFLGAGAVVISMLGIFAILEYFMPSSSYLHGTDKFVAVRLSYRRVGSLLGAPNVLAGLYVLILPILTALYLVCRKRWHQAVVAVLLGLTLVSFAMTLAFLCTLSFVVVSALLSPWLFREFTGRRPGRVFWSLLVLAALGALAFILSHRGDLSVSARWGYLQAAWVLIKSYGFLGSGADTFRFLSPAHTQELTYSGYVHNSYLQLWLETGILGLAGVCLFLITLFRQVRHALAVVKERSQRLLIVGLAWGFAGFLVDNLNNFTLIDNMVSVYFWALLGWWSALQPAVRTVPLRAVFTAVLIALVALLGVKVAAHRQFLSAYQNGMQALEQKEYLSGFKQMQEAEGISPLNQHVHAGKGFFYLQIYLLAGDAQFLDKARENYQEAARLCPNYYMNYVMLSKIANEQEDHEALKAYVKRLKELCPSRHPFLEKELRQARENKALTKRP